MVGMRVVSMETITTLPNGDIVTTHTKHAVDAETGNAVEETVSTTTATSNQPAEAAVVKETTNSKSKKVYWILAGALVLLILVGIAVGVGVAVSGKKKRSGGTSTSANGNTANQDTASDGNTTPHCVPGQVRRFQLKDLYVYPENSSADTLPLLDEQECIDHCAAQGHTTGFFSTSFATLDSCQCLESDMIDCLLPWGENINTNDRYSNIAEGTLFTSECRLKATTCSFDYCDKNPEDPWCFTGNQYALQTYSVRVFDDLEPAAETSSRNTEDCLNFCHAYFIAQFANPGQGDTCKCWSKLQFDCLLPWGDNVDTEEWITRGTIYVKEAVSSCPAGQDWCTDNPDHWLCLTGHTVAQGGAGATFKASPVGDNLVLVRASQNTPTERVCLNFCAGTDAATFNSYFDTCTCHNNVDCMAAHGNKIDDDGLNAFRFGTVYLRNETPSCPQDLCSYDSNQWYCLSGNQRPRDQVTPYGANLMVTQQATKNNVVDCLEYCRQSEAADYNLWYDMCTCFDNVACLATYNPEDVDTNVYDLDFGTLYLKDSRETCLEDLCTLDPANWLCFTGTARPRSQGAPVGGTLVSVLSGIASARECWMECAFTDAIVYNDWYDRCECYADVQCMAPLGVAANLNDRWVTRSTVYAKPAVASLGTCTDRTWCGENPTAQECLAMVGL